MRTNFALSLLPGDRNKWRQQAMFGLAQAFEKVESQSRVTAHSSLCELMYRARICLPECCILVSDRFVSDVCVGYVGKVARP
jgi:hypothetical protein